MFPTLGIREISSFRDRFNYQAGNVNLPPPLSGRRRFWVGVVVVVPRVAPDNRGKPRAVDAVHTRVRRIAVPAVAGVVGDALRKHRERAGQDEDEVQRVHADRGQKRDPRRNDYQPIPIGRAQERVAPVVHAVAQYLLVVRLVKYEERLPQAARLLVRVAWRVAVLVVQPVKPSPAQRAARAAQQRRNRAAVLEQRHAELKTLVAPVSMIAHADAQATVYKIHRSGRQGRLQPFGGNDLGPSGTLRAI